MELAEVSDHFQPPTDERAIAKARDNVRSLTAFNQQHNASAYSSAGREGIETVGVVGGGMMGAAIAAASAQCGLRVVVVDSSDDALARLPEQVNAALVAGGDDANSQSCGDSARLVQATKDIEAVTHCDLVVETVTEDRFVKQPLIAELESKLGATKGLASNTATIAIAKLAANLVARDRFCGVHFLRPVHERRLVEIVRGPDTGPPAIATAVAYAETIRKIPLVVNDSPGFLINRLLLPYAAEAMGLLIEGATIEAVERTAVEFGMVLGPFALLDEVGLDTALDCGWVFAGAHCQTRRCLWQWSRLAAWDERQELASSRTRIFRSTPNACRIRRSTRSLLVGPTPNSPILQKRLPAGCFCLSCWRQRVSCRRRPSSIRA